MSYSTALRWFHDGVINGYQAPSGTAIVVEENRPATVQERVAMYARAAFAEHRENLERQAERLAHSCMTRG
jgi:putative resolvase